MPSTYTVNLGIEKPATGEQSGTWGDTTNVNFDILDQAINGAERVTLTSAGSSGSPNALNITNGATSDGRNKWIEFYSSGDLGGSVYVQLVPNDAEKIVFVRNSLASSRSILLFQGTYNSGRDLEIPAGVDMVVKFDGGGASAATVTDVFTKLRATEITTPTLTATTADINGGTIDNSVIGGSTAAAVTGTAVVANTSLNIAGDGATVTGIKDEDNMASNSATKLATQQSIKAYVDSQVGTVDTWAEVLANGATSGSTNPEVTAGQALKTNTINETSAGSGVTIDSVLLKDDVVNATDIETSSISANDGTPSATIANTTGNFTITNFVSNSVDIGGGAIDGTVIGGASTAAGSFTTLDASGAFTGTTATLTTADNATQLTLVSTDADASHGPVLDLKRDSSSPADNDPLGLVRFLGENDADGALTYARIYATIRDASNGTEDGMLSFNTVSGGANKSRLELDTTESVFNESGADIDFRVETSNASHALFLDSANDRMGIFESSPVYTFDVDAETRFQKQINYGGYTSEYPADVVTVTRGSAASDTAWVKIGTLDNPGQADILYSCGTSASEETGIISLVQTYSGSNLGLTVKRQTYNRQVTKVRVVQVGAGGTDYEIWVQIDNGSDQTSDPYVRAIVKLAQTLSIGNRWTYAMSVGTPGTAATEVDLDVSAGGSASSARNQTAYAGFTNNSLGAIFNNDGADSDFRVESANNTHTLFVDSSADKVMVGTSVAPNTFSVLGSFYNAGFYRNFTGAGTAANYVGIGRTDSAGNLVDGVRITGGGDENAEASHNGYFNLEIRNSGNFRSLLSAFSSGNELVVNDGGLDMDFRVESDSNVNMLLVDAGNNRVGVGVSPTARFEIQDTNNVSIKFGDLASYPSNVVPCFIGTGTSALAGVNGDLILVPRTSDQGKIIFATGHNGAASENMRVFDGGITINEDGADRDFRVESNNNANMLFVDGGNDKIGVGTNAPTEMLEVFSEAASTAIEVSAGKASTTTGESKLVLRSLHAASGTSYSRSEIASLAVAGGDSDLIFRTTTDTNGPQDRLKLDAEGNFDFNPNENNNIFRVRNGSLNDALVVQGGGSGVGIVGIGTDAALFSSGEALGVKSTSTLAIGGENNSTSAATLYLKNLAYDGTSTERTLVFFQANSGNRGSITSNGSGVTYNTSSDIRLKTDIQPIKNAAETLLSMNPVTHKWKADPEADTVHGFIAQEMQNIVPEAVSGDPDGEEMMSMDYGRITPIIVAALQDATNEIKALKERVKELEAS